MYNAQETKEMRSTIALELARHKIQVRMANGYRYPSLDNEDLNELFVVAGLPTLEVGDLEQEVDLINIQKEDE